MPVKTSVCDIEVDAVDGAAAVDLEHRLWYLTPTTVGRGRDWIVEIPGPTSVEDVAAVVRTWLDDLGEPSTTIRAGGRMLEIQSHHRWGGGRPQRHFDFIG